MYSPLDKGQKNLCFVDDFRILITIYFLLFSYLMLLYFQFDKHCTFFSVKSHQASTAVFDVQKLISFFKYLFSYFNHNLEKIWQETLFTFTYSLHILFENLFLKSQITLIGNVCNFKSDYILNCIRFSRKFANKI